LAGVPIIKGCDFSFDTERGCDIMPSNEEELPMAKRMITHKKAAKEPSEKRRFEVLLEEIRGELKLVSEAYTASVERDQKLDAKIDRLEIRIDRMHHEFFDFVNKVHGELSGQIANVRNELKQEIQDVRNELKQEIQEVKNELKQEIQDVEVHLRKEIQEVKEMLVVHDKRISALEQV
jgi:gas vesicle protein